jgi:hypothetical protein
MVSSNEHKVKHFFVDIYVLMLYTRHMENSEKESNIAHTFMMGFDAGVTSAKGTATLVERERILQGIQRLEEQSESTRTPLYQETLFAKIREIING